jgi:hypothetical protein
VVVGLRARIHPSRLLDFQPKIFHAVAIGASKSCWRNGQAQREK